jgi:hypothetical protein
MAKAADGEQSNVASTKITVAHEATIFIEIELSQFLYLFMKAKSPPRVPGRSRAYEFPHMAYQSKFPRRVFWL